MSRTAVAAALAAAVTLTAAVPAAAEATDPGAEELAALRAQLARLEARIVELEASQSRVPVEDLAAAAPAVAPAAVLPGWLERVSFAGDFRFRNEWIDLEDTAERSRQRIRARFGATAEVTDSVTTYVQMATGGFDPRSANQTLGDSFSRKEWNLDLAYLRWAAMDGLDLLAGKMKNPIQRPAQGRFIDNDITPEGMAATWESDGFFLVGAGYWGVERSRDDDTWALVLQAGYKGAIAGGLTLTAAASYTDWANTRLLGPLLPFGNTVDADGNLVNDYDLLEGYVELGTALGSLPLSLFAQYGVNTDPDDEDTAYGLGALLGKTGAPGTWQVGYAYHHHEKDALLAQVVDSNFGGGATGARGHVLTGGYSLASNVTVNLSYFVNEVYDLELVEGERDYKRVMLDLSVKY